MKKILFFIPNLSVGGAEKVLVNLVNNMDRNEFDISVKTLFGGGVNEQFLKSDIKYSYCFKKTFRGNSQILKMFSPEFLYRHFIKEHYDIIVSYLEGPTARIVSGCNDKDTKLVSWIHIQQENAKVASYAFKSFSEAKACYERFDNTVCVSQYVMQDFKKIFDFKGKIEVLYNTNETADILRLSKETEGTEIFSDSEIKICVVGKVSKRKGTERICNIQKKLKENGYNTHFYFLGTGDEEENVRAFASENNLRDSITLLGYQTNPYKFVSKCDLFVCASYAEGFSTAATEALIVGTPVVTVEVSGMKEMLGENDEYGIVTEQSEDALYSGIEKIIGTDGMLFDYSKRATERGKYFSTENTVRAVEKMLKGV